LFKQSRIVVGLLLQGMTMRQGTSVNADGQCVSQQWLQLAASNSPILFELLLVPQSEF
jgi:hypothetical protein